MVGKSGPAASADSTAQKPDKARPTLCDSNFPRDAPSWRKFSVRAGPHLVRGSTTWIKEVQDWISVALEFRDTAIHGQLVEYTTQPWSSVWTLDTSDGRYWFKECNVTQCSEGPVHCLIAALAPHYADQPIASAPANGWIFTADGGATMLSAGVSTAARWVEAPELGRMLCDYAQLQRRTIGHEPEFVEAGLRSTDPRDAADLAEAQVAWMAGLPHNDPRYVTPQQHAKVIAALPALTEAGRVLANGPVPLAFEHGDLWPQNVFLPQSSAAHYRFFDFAEAHWSHPFLSLAIIFREWGNGWSASEYDNVIDCRNQNIQAAFDAYLAQWIDFAPLKDLRMLAGYALRLAPIHRSNVWLSILDDADHATLARHGGMPWAWLQNVTKVMLL